MKEIGGYIELDRYALPMMHEGAVALNTGRSCLAYLIQARKIKKILIPVFLCDTVEDTCYEYGVEVRKYHIGDNLRPKAISHTEDEWLYLVNYYGQISCEEVLKWKEYWPRLIVDNVQAFFEEPVPGVDTLYSCRKFFGVPDGAFCYTDARLERTLPQDESHERMGFLLGRFERPASEFYSAYQENNRALRGQGIKRMSRLTDNLLHGIDYGAVKARRTENFLYLRNRLAVLNRLSLRQVEGAFAYPLRVQGGRMVREALVKKKVYIPTLWPNVLENGGAEERDLAENILPLPCDQRYTVADMEYLAGLIEGICPHKA